MEMVQRRVKVIKEKVRCSIKDKGSVEKTGRIAERKDRNLKEKLKEVTKTETAEEAIRREDIKDGQWSRRVQQKGRKEKRKRGRKGCRSQR